VASKQLSWLKSEATERSLCVAFKKERHGTKGPARVPRTAHNWHVCAAVHPQTSKASRELTTRQISLSWVLSLQWNLFASDVCFFDYTNHCKSSTSTHAVFSLFSERRILVKSSGSVIGRVLIRYRLHNVCKSSLHFKNSPACAGLHLQWDVFSTELCLGQWDVWSPVARLGSTPSVSYCRLF